MRRTLLALMLVSSLILLSVPGTFARKISGRSKNIEMNLSFSSHPMLNEELTVTFIFTPLEDIVHKNQLNDEVKITFDSGIELINGQVYWEGRLKKGETHTLQAVLKPVTEGPHIISAHVRCCQIDPCFIGQDRLLEIKTGMKYFGKAFEYHNDAKKQFKIGAVDNKIEIPVIKVATGEKSKMKVNAYSLPPFDNVATLGKVRTSTDRKQPMEQTHILRSPEKEYSFPIQRAKEMPDSIIRVSFVREIQLRKGESVIILLYDQDKRSPVKAIWSCEPKSSCIIEILPNGKIRITSLSLKEYIITGIFAGWEHRIRVISSSADYHISGRFRYVDNWGDTLDMMEMLVSSEYRSGGGWVVESWTHTDENGYFDVYTPGHDTIGFFVWSYHRIDADNRAGWVFKTDGHLDENDSMLLYKSGVGYINVYEDLQMPDDAAVCTALTHTGAYEITNVIRRGYNRVTDVVGWVDRPHFCYTYWDNADSLTMTLYKRLIVEPDNVGVIEIQGEAVSDAFGARDQWDWSVILHEYGHFMMDWYAQLPPHPSYTRSYYLPASGPGVIPAYIAWMEGWATFFACFALSDLIEIPEYIDRLNDNSLWLRIDLEQPEPDVPYWIQGIDQTGASDSICLYSGFEVEGAIAEALWDIFDFQDDDNYMQNDSIWGHNNDHNQYDSWRGPDSIWGVLLNYDPDVLDDEHNYCYDFYEFIAGWVSRGHPRGGHFEDICRSHCIDPYSTDVQEQDLVLLNPDRICLSNNYPNPFNSTTTIEFYVPRAKHVNISIYNIQGQKVKTLMKEQKGKGNYTIRWDGTDNKGIRVASGIYFCRMKADDLSEAKKIVLLK